MTNSNGQTYYIYDRIGPRVEFIPFDPDNRPSGQRGWLMHHRTSDEGGTSDGDD